ncbi:MAG TPA: helix-turn-helix domain-containing protein [Micromonosporaceae bacterium]
MTGSPDELLTTGEVAVLLRSSRQHVVDLCERGLLPYVRAGTHRRVRRADVEAVLRPDLTRDQLKALWLHRAVAGRLVTDPGTVLSKARANLDRLRRIHPDGMAAVWLDRWRTVLEDGAEAVLDVLTSRAPNAVELRQNSPFAGVLSEVERRAVLAAFAAQWREARTA